MSDSILNSIDTNLFPKPPVLQQSKSSIVTNSFIPNEQKQFELEEIQKQANGIIEDNYKQNQNSSIANMSLKYILQNMSNSVVGLIDDLFSKPDNVPWTHYLPDIIAKDQRYAFIGIILLIIALYIHYR
jgi:hypothetical protein